MKKLARARTSLFLAVLSVSVISFFLMGQPAYATDCEGIQTNIVDCSTVNDTTGSPVVAILVVAIQILTGLIGVVAIGALVYAGILYSSASGNASQTAKAKEIIRNTLIGLAAFAAIGVLLNYLIPGGLFTGNAKFGAGGNGMGNIIAKDLNLGDPSNPSSDDSEIISTSPYSLTFGTWNTFVDNPTSKGATVSSIMSSVDILGLQEVHSLDGRKDIKSIESNSIGVYFTSALQSGGASQLSYPVVYNKNKLTFVSGGYKRLGSTPGLADKYVTYVRLRIKQTGQELFVLNTQLPPGVDAAGKPKSGSNTASAYKSQMEVLKSTVKQVEANGLPTFLVGDFNVNFRKEECATSWFPCQSLRSVDMKSAFELTKIAGIPKAMSTQGPDGRLIDYVFVHTDSRVKVNSSEVYGGISCTNRKPDPDCYHGSDHRPSIAHITITSKESTSPSTTAPSGTVTLQGVQNFRDLALLNSNLVKSGVIYRSEKLADATANDRSQLSAALKDGAIIDLRTKSKRAESPDKTISGVPNLSYPVTSAAGASEYVDVFVNSKADRQMLGSVITKIANTKGAVLFHCTYGKDRTGWVASMLLYIMGASDSQVMTEYLRSNSAGADFKVSASWLNAALSAARKNNNGSIMNYIRSGSSGLGVSDATITKLKAKLGK